MSSPCPYLFVVGCPRSGTTLLQRMLDSHPQLAVANDCHFITRGLEKFAPELLAAAVGGKNPGLSPGLLAAVRSYHRFARLGVPEDRVDEISGKARTYAGFVSALYAEYAAMQGKALAGEKTPDYVRHIPLLSGLFPKARFLHIIRDGRDVALSLRDWAHENKGPGRLSRWRQDPIAVSALWWQWQVECGRKAGRHLGDQRYLEVQYQALVTEPEGELRRVANFLELPFSERMLEFHTGRRKAQGQLSAKSAWLPATSGLRNWRSDLTAKEIALFEALSGSLLDALGMPRTSSQPEPAIETQAADFRSWWSDHLRKRRSKARARRQPSV